MTLCILPVTPHPTGDGASQRSWHMLNALAKVRPVDLVVLHQADRPALRAIPLQPACDVARTVRFVAVPAWSTTSEIFRNVPRSVGRIADLARIGSVETPRLPRAALARIAEELPSVVDTVFVGRLSTACIVDDLFRAGFIQVRRRIVDFDDVMSRFRRLQVHQQAADMSTLIRHWQLFIARRLEAAEARIARTWDACAVASEEDVPVLSNAYPGVRVYHLPNVVEHSQVEPAATPREKGRLNLLFVGNLSYPPNAEGIGAFLDQVWPQISRSGPNITLSIVGRSPDAHLIDRARRAGVALHADVPDVRPYYHAADAVIAPIHFGGGTRVKIVEAMSLGKPIISTPFGVEGLAIRHRVHALLSETPQEMLAAVRALADDPELGIRLARKARQLQHERYSSRALDQMVRHVLDKQVTTPANVSIVPETHTRRSGMEYGAMRFA